MGMFEKQREARRKLEEQKKEKKEEENAQKKETFRFFELRREWSMLKDEQKTEKLAEIEEEFKKFVDEKNEEKIITQFIESVRIGQSIDEISKIISQNSETSTICLLTKIRDAITKNEGTVPSCIS